MKEQLFEIGLGGYTIIQAPNMTKTQMMSYLIVTPNGKLVVIDGGLRGDSAYLTEKIHEYGSVVSYWIITHVHSDHYYALVDIAGSKDMRGITIEKLCYNFPPAEWILEAEPQYAQDNMVFFDVLPMFDDIAMILNEGDELDVDGMMIDIMKVPDDYLEFDPGYTGGSTVNDTCVVFRLIFPNGKKALFLGDLGFRAGQKLAKRFGEKLKSEIVQMAHHGQNGAGEDVYKLVRPEICMWTAPMWLYDNNLWYRDKRRKNKFDSHHFKTVEVRRWMEKLEVRHHAVEGMGQARII
ncbi:MAG TPA: MBL fold metallo-hydrolase [Clostridia bacterium]|nr:MBL fold metallo-hydrolase [Clostridia bacterium]